MKLSLLKSFRNVCYLLIAITIVSCGDEEFIPPTTPTPSTSFEVNIVHHISRDDTGQNAVTDAANIETMMTFLNTNFSEWEIKFTTKEVRFVDNTQWNQQFVKQDDFLDERVLKSFEDAKSVNLFYFNVLANRSNGVIVDSIGATALFPDQGNNIKLSSSAFKTNNTATITHELGHFLGLFHTSDDNSDNAGNLELVDGSNCKDAGDFICDTPASPDLNDSNLDESTCRYFGTETDVNGALYTPDVFNFMTQWAGEDSAGNLCRRRFTSGQVEKMKEVLTLERAYLIE